MLYDQNAVIFQDYGAVRYLNVPQRQGGRYLAETHTWARQTVAHNTVVVNQRSNYDGNFRIADRYHSNAFYFNIDNPSQQVMSAFDTTAYPGVFMQRTMAMIANYEAWGNKPIIIDVFRLVSETANSYDLVFNHPSTVSLIATDVERYFHQIWRPLGEDAGYQHLFNRAQGVASGYTAYFTFFLPTGIRFYTLITETVPGETEIFFTQVGANDPDFVLRPDRSIIIRNNNVGNFTFASIIEPHGVYNEPFEYTLDAFSLFERIETLQSNDEACIVLLTERCGRQWVFATANNTPDNTVRHSHTVGGQRLEWTGNFMFSEITFVAPPQRRVRERRTRAANVVAPPAPEPAPVSDDPFVLIPIETLPEDVRTRIQRKLYIEMFRAETVYQNPETNEIRVSAISNEAIVVIFTFDSEGNER
jgi:hypothetical protein